MIGLVTVDPGIGASNVPLIALWLLFAGACIACVWKCGI